MARVLLLPGCSGRTVDDQEIYCRLEFNITEIVAIIGEVSVLIMLEPYKFYLMTDLRSDIISPSLIMFYRRNIGVDDPTLPQFIEEKGSLSGP
jgi:hypothetical protein